LTINLNCGIYQIRNIITGVCYSGQSIHLKQRPGEHWRKLKNNKHDNIYLQNSYNKHGREFFVFEILIYCSPEELTYYEQLFYNIDKVHGLSYNIRDCVDSNRGIKFSEETCKKMRLAQGLQNHPLWGKHHSEESKELMSLSAKNKAPITEITRKKMREAWKNRLPITEETREKMCEAKRGKNHPFYGKTHSKETIEKMSESAKNRSPVTEETRKKLSALAKNRPPITEETKEKMKKARTIKKEIILEILKLLENDMSVADILKEIDIGKNTIYKIKNGGYDDIYDLPKDDK